MDWLIICLKAYHFTAAKPLIERLIGPETKIAVIRNGLNLKEAILPFASDARILECIIDCPTQPNDEGYYVQLKRPSLTTEISILSSQFYQLFASNVIVANQVEDFKSAQWKKLIESASLGAILALTGETCRIFEDKELLKLHRDLLKEGIKVAIEDGAKIEDHFENDLAVKLKSYDKNKGSSMLTDRLTGRQIELDAKNGAILKYAQKYGVKVPLTNAVCALLRPINGQTDRPDF